MNMEAAGFCSIQQGAAPAQQLAAEQRGASKLRGGCGPCRLANVRPASERTRGAGASQRGAAASRRGPGGPGRCQLAAARGAMMEAATHLPMRSHEVKNSTPVDEIRQLRLITAIKTPYLPDGRFDLAAYDSLVNLQIAGGAEGLIVGGTTGEGQLMSWDEHVMLIAHTVNCFGDRVKVIGNTGSNATREAVHATEQGFAVGMHAALQINPYYGKTSPEGMLAHFRALLPLGPSIIYNVPGRTGQDIPPAVIAALGGHPSFAGVKECVGSARIAAIAAEGLTVWSGNDDQCHADRWEHGARGVISVFSNLAPGLARELMYGGRNDALARQVAPLVRWLFAEPNPIGLNTALAQLGLVRPVFRLPYVPYAAPRRREFVQLVRDLGPEHFVGGGAARVLDDDEFVLLSRY